VRFSGGSAFLFNNVRGGGELIPLVEGVIVSRDPWARSFAYASLICSAGKRVQTEPE
jgi:hypothetical protein